MDKDELVKVHTVKDSTLAEIIKNALRADGIACEIGGEHQAGFTDIFDIDILVRAEDEDAARKIIQSHEPQ